MASIIEAVTTYPRGEIKNQMLALLLVWNKDLINFTLTDIEETIERIKNGKVGINYEPIKYHVNLANSNGKLNEMERFVFAKEELLRDKSPKMIREEMGTMFIKPEELESKSMVKRKKIQMEETFDEKENPAKEVIKVSKDFTILQILTKVYEGKESSAKTFLTKNAIPLTEKDFVSVLEKIAKSTSKFKNNAKEIIESLKVI